MSDLDLRELERQAQAQPEDLGVGLAYARALARSGRRQAQVSELSRLVRQGNVFAARELASLTPWSSRGGANRTWRSRRRGLTAVARVQCFDLPKTPPETGRGFVGATDQALVFESPDGLEVVSHESGETLWRVVDPAAAEIHTHTEDMGCCFGSHRQVELDAAVVSDAVVLHWQGRLELRAALDGSVRSSAEVVARSRGLAVEGDRLVLHTVSPEANAVVAVELGERFGREIWRAPLQNRGDDALDWPTGAAPFLTRGLVLLRVRGALEARRVDSGDLAWRADLAQYGKVVAADELGVIVEEPGTRRGLSLEDGRTLWALDHLEGPLCLGEQVIVTRSRRADRVERMVDGMAEVSVSVSYELLAVERETGKRRRARPAEKVVNQTTVVTDSALYAVTSEDAVRLAAFSLTTGGELFETPITGLGRRAYAKIDVVPLDGALLVVVRSGNTTSFARLE